MTYAVGLYKKKKKQVLIAFLSYSGSIPAWTFALPKKRLGTKWASWWFSLNTLRISPASAL